MKKWETAVPVADSHPFAGKVCCAHAVCLQRTATNSAHTLVIPSACWCIRESSFQQPWEQPAWKQLLQPAESQQHYQQQAAQVK